MNKITYTILLIAVSFLSFIAGRENLNYELEKEQSRNNYITSSLNRENYILMTEYNRCVFMEWETAFNLDSCEHGWEEEIGPMCGGYSIHVPQKLEEQYNWDAKANKSEKTYD